jgi:hypothetical protein
MPKVCGLFPPIHYELLNEIHASRARRNVVGEHTFTKPELDEISLKIGDISAQNPIARTFTPLWDRAEQPRLVAATLAAMAEAFPYISEEA